MQFESLTQQFLALLRVSRLTREIMEEQKKEYEQFVIFVGDRAVFSRKGVLAKDVITPLSVPKGQMRVHVIGRDAENKPINVFVEGTNVSVLKQWK